MAVQVLVKTRICVACFCPNVDFNTIYVDVPQFGTCLLHLIVSSERFEKVFLQMLPSNVRNYEILFISTRKEDKNAFCYCTKIINFFKKSALVDDAVQNIIKNSTLIMFIKC